eukprot:1009295-Prorocentrum_minimum.AAC.2
MGKGGEFVAESVDSHTLCAAGSTVGWRSRRGPQHRLRLQTVRKSGCTIRRGGAPGATGKAPCGVPSGVWYPGLVHLVGERETPGNCKTVDR